MSNFKAEAIAEYLMRLSAEVARLKKILGDKDALDELDLGEPEVAYAPTNPMIRNGMPSFITIVRSVYPASSYFTAVKALPAPLTSATTFWLPDMTLTTLVTAYLPKGVTCPAIGDTVAIHNTGEVAEGTPRYGMLSGSVFLERYEISAIYDDTLDVRLLKPVVDEFADDSPIITVRKPWDLQRTYYEGRTIDGVSSTYVDEQTRDVTDGAVDERWIVIPPYRVGTSWVYLVRVLNGAGNGAEQGQLMDANVAGRIWCKEYVAP